MSSRTRYVAPVALACVLVLSAAVPALGAAAVPDASSQQVRGAATPADRSVPNTEHPSASRPFTPGNGSADPGRDPGEVPPGLRKANGTVDVVVRLSSARVSRRVGSERARQRLKQVAEKTQRPLLKFSRGRSGVRVLKRFWLTNAVLVRVDTSRVDVDSLASVEHVERLHPNFRVSLPGSGNATSSAGNAAESATPDSHTENGYDVTYGLDQVNATEAWERYHTRGGGVKVAVLDTGVDAGHPAIDLYTRDPGDPTYPGGWAEFDADGQRVEGSTPHDTGYHGTHVSATVAGGNASGRYVGVAPNVSLMHGLVLPGGSGTFTQIIGGMQWAVEQNADVVIMSLGSQGTYPSFIKPVRNARAAGTVVVAATGNEGAGTSGSPANVYGALAVGATDESRAVPWYSSGEVIDTREDWYPFAPSSWPVRYTVPDVTAPGDDVFSALPRDYTDSLYGKRDGTSMAAPHVAGVAALALSASRNASVAQVTDAVASSAWKPASCDPSCSPRNGTDPRYGAGIVDAADAADRLAADAGVTGTVTGAGGDPIPNATLTLDGFTVETDANGRYTLRESPGNYTVSASAFGYESVTRTVTVTNDTFTSVNLTLSRSLAVAVTDPSSDVVRPGNATTVTFRAAHVETWTVERAGNYTGDASLTVNGERAAFGEQVAIQNDTGSVTVTVSTADGGAGTLRLAHEVTGIGETTTVRTGPTLVTSDVYRVGVVGAYKFGYAPGVMRVLDDRLPANYRLHYLTVADALNATDAYDVFVVQNFGHYPADETVRAFARATSDPDTGVVYLDQPKEPYPRFAKPTTSNAITQLSRATNDPKRTRNDGTFGTHHANYTVRERHPVLDGVGRPGDNVTMLRFDAAASFAWFEEYSGQTLATTTVPRGDYFGTTPGPRGPGIAVNEQTRTVLAAGLGVTSEVPASALTSDAKTTLANSVTYLSADPPVTVAKDQAAQVAPGERVTARFDATGVRGLTVSVAARSTVDAANASLTVNGNPAAFGERVAVENDTGTVTVTVETSDAAAGTLALETAFDTGGGHAFSVVTGPTAVYDPPLTVGEDVASVETATEMARPGTTVYLANGTYETRLVADVPDVTFTAAPGATPTLRAPDGLDEFAGVVRVEAANVTVSDVTVVGNPSDDDYYGVHVLSHDATLRNLSVRRSGTGIQVADIASNVTDTTIANVTVANATDGVVVGVGSGFERTAGLRVTDVTVRHAETAFFVETASGGVFRNLTVTDATEGFSTWAPRHVTLADSTFRRVTTGVVFGSNAVDFTVTGNRIRQADTGIFVRGSPYQTGRIRLNDVDADVGVTFENKEYATVAVHYNDLSDTRVAAANTAPWWSDDPPAFSPDLRLNYFGPRGPNATQTRNVRYDPFLTAPPRQVDREQTASIATDLRLSANQTTTLGVPGPTVQTAADALGRNFTGTVSVFDAENETWRAVENRSALDLDAFDALRVTPQTDARVVLRFTGENPPGQPPETPPEVTPGNRRAKTALQPGDNVVAARAYGPVGDVFTTKSGAITRVAPAGTQPASQLGPAGTLSGPYVPGNSSGPGPNVSAFAAYRVTADKRANYRSGVPANPTVAELYAGLRLGDPAITGVDTALEPVDPDASDATVAQRLYAAASDRAATVGATTDNRTAIEQEARAAVTRKAERLGIRLPDRVVDRIVDAAVRYADPDARRT